MVEAVVAEYGAGLDMYLWGPILAKHATLNELSTVYTLDDLVDMNNAINLQHEINEAVREATKNDN